MVADSILFNQEVLVVLNSNGVANQAAEITVDASFHPVGSQMKVLYRSDWSDAELKNPPSNQTLEVTANQSRATVRMQLPPAGMAILANFSTLGACDQIRFLSSGGHGLAGFA